jgi:5-methylcytosine-specific restriction endonuclease McrA
MYNSWNNNKGKWNIPTLDHIIPLSRGGDFFDLDNIQILTWFENRAKAEMTQKEWEDFKIITSTKSDLFI